LIYFNKNKIIIITLKTVQCGHIWLMMTMKCVKKLNGIHYYNIMNIIIRARKTTLSIAGKTEKQTDVRCFSSNINPNCWQRCWHDICLYFANNIILLFITIMIVWCCRVCPYFQQFECITEASFNTKKYNKMGKNCTLVNIYI